MADRTAPPPGELEVLTCEQGTADWFAARLGIPTASEFSTCMAKGKGGAPSKTRTTYMMKLLGERMTGVLTDNFNNIHMERGKRLEAEAREVYGKIKGVWTDLVGFLRRGAIGCSPDALIGDDGMTEIKTKLPHLQLEALLGGTVPSDHVAQVQGQLWVADREWLDFVSYFPDTPPLIVRVERDEAKIAEIAAAVLLFNEDMAKAQVDLEIRYGKEWFAKKPVRLLGQLDPAREFENLDQFN